MSTTAVQRCVVLHDRAQIAEKKARDALATALRRYCRKRGVRELARLSGVSPTAVSMFFNGNPRAVSRSKALRILRLDAAVPSSEAPNE